MTRVKKASKQGYNSESLFAVAAEELIILLIRNTNRVI
jgi:hypothetical protein